jgi:ABC-type multidrug transport system ATPase subunit
MFTRTASDLIVGYVQQQDLHLETSTVREALRFSAVLRQPQSKPLNKKYADVEEIIEVCYRTWYESHSLILVDAGHGRIR